jgi:hypothetical protein
MNCQAKARISHCLNWSFLLGDIEMVFVDYKCRIQQRENESGLESAADFVE